MRVISSIFFTLAVATAATAVMPGAQAEPYKWCAQYGGGRGGY